MGDYNIVTLTVNPALDKSTRFKGLVPEQKIRCESPRYDAGGGGINVSKAIARLGGQSFCVFTSGICQLELCLNNWCKKNRFFLKPFLLKVGLEKVLLL